MIKSRLSNVTSRLLASETPLLQQLRTTFVLERRWPPGLHKVNAKPKPLRGRHYVYDLVKDTSIAKQPDINVILTSYVDGYGNPGERLSVKPTTAYHKLLLPGLAVYATPENLKKYKRTEQPEAEQVKHSSAFAQRTVNVLSQYVLNVVMNKDTAWVLEPWHVRASFRKSGFHVAEEAIALPPKPISGPDMEIEGKMFYVTVTINGTETVCVRCVLHHWSTQITERLPYVQEFWKHEMQALFPEDEPVLRELTRRAEQTV